MARRGTYRLQQVAHNLFKIFPEREEELSIRVDGDEVPLLMGAELFDQRDLGNTGKLSKNYPYVFNFGLMVRPEYMGDDYRDVVIGKEDVTRDELLREAWYYTGEAPVHVYDYTRDDELGAESVIIDEESRIDHATHHSVYFKTRDNAMEYLRGPAKRIIKDVIAKDPRQFLEQRINLAGKTGIEVIERQID